ncbi:hypothetical protein ACFL1Z_07700 [Thermodesulfobacteriota bacterium]
MKNILEPWIIDELKDFQIARKALGVLKYPWVIIEPNTYMSFWREKVAYIIGRTPDYRGAIETFIHPRIVFDLPQNPSPEWVVEVMHTVEGWDRQARNLSL